MQAELRQALTEREKTRSKESQITTSQQENLSLQTRKLSENEVKKLKETIELKKTNYLKEIEKNPKNFEVNLRTLFIDPNRIQSNDTIREVFYNLSVQSNNPLKNILGPVFNDYINNLNMKIEGLHKYQQIAINVHRSLNKRKLNTVAKDAYKRLLQDN